MNRTSQATTLRSKYTHGDTEVVCGSCEQSLPLDSFDWRSDRPRPRTVCTTCRSQKQRARYLRHKQNSYFKHKASRAKSRAKILGVPFSLTDDYLESIWTGTCPAMGVELDLDVERGSDDAVELDRLIPDLGYVVGNVAFISRRANRVKSNMSLEELEMIVTWMKSAAIE